MGNTIWWQSLTIGIYIGGLGLGAYYSDKLKDFYHALIKVELGLSFFGAICVVGIYFFHSFYNYKKNFFIYSGYSYSPHYLQTLFLLKIAFFLAVQFLTLSIGILSGFEIPLMMKILNERLGHSEEREHWILGINYVGTLIGTICFAYYFFPKMDVIKTSVATALLNLAVCIYCLWKYGTRKRTIYSGLIVTVLVVISLIGFNEKRITQRYLKFFYFLPKILTYNKTQFNDVLKIVDDLNPINRSKSLYQYIDMFIYPMRQNGQNKNSTILTLDTQFQFSTATEFYYHQAFAHLSIAMNKKIPKRVLLLGGGDGLLLRELLKYKEIESIVHIELDSKMIDLAKTQFAELNQHSLDNPRVHSQINDGFYYVRNTTDKYDAIFIDFPYPNSYDLAKLYSLEFYTYVRKTLNLDGFVVLDVPFFDKTKTHSLDEREIMNNNVMASTLYYSGFQTLFPYEMADESFLFLKITSRAINDNFIDTINISMLDTRSIQAIKEIKKQKFPYSLDLKYVNSVFKPKMMRKSDF